MAAVLNDLPRREWRSDVASPAGLPFLGVRLALLRAPPAGREDMDSANGVLEANADSGAEAGQAVGGAADDAEDGAMAGMARELLIGGIQLADGYLNRAQLTATKFVRLQKELVMPLPTTRATGGEGASGGEHSDADDRWFLTGDLAEWRGDQGLQLLGRIDQQVLRGGSKGRF